MVVFLMVLFVVALAFLHRHVYNRYWDKKFYFNLDVDNNSVFEGGIVRFKEIVENRKLLPLPWVEVNFVLSRNFVSVKQVNKVDMDYQYRVDLFSMFAKRQVSLETDYVCANRGFYRVDNFMIGSYNLMMTNWNARIFPNNVHVTVYPRLIDVSEMEIPYKKLAGEILARRFIMTDPFQFRGIREYQPYDNFKTINFKASARMGGLMSNVFDFTVSQEIFIVLNLQRYSYVSNWIINENAIRLAAFFARYYIGVGIPVGFLTNGCDIITNDETEIYSGHSQAHLTNIYEALARINLKNEPHPITEFLDSDFTNTERVYVLISSYYGKDLVDWFERARMFGSNSLWVIPYDKNETITMPFGDLIVGWGVTA